MNKRIYSIKRFVTVTVEYVDKAVKLQCWMSPLDVWGNQSETHPHNYTFDDDDGGIVIQSNEELTPLAISMIAEYSNVIIHQQQIKNDKRKIANL